MAYTTTSTLLLALMLVATASVVHCSLVIDGKTIDVVDARGSLVCKSTGTGAEGVSVSMSLGNITVATCETDGCGDFLLEVNIDVGGVDLGVSAGVGVGVGVGNDIGVDVGLSDIIIAANVPAGTCNASSPAKVVTSPVLLAGITVGAGGSFTANVTGVIDI